MSFPLVERSYVRQAVCRKTTIVSDWKADEGHRDCKVCVLDRVSQFALEKEEDYRGPQQRLHSKESAYDI